MSTKITPQSDSNLDVTVTESDNLVSLDIQPASFIITGAGLGTVTQVITGTGLTGGPITTSGTIAVDSTVATLDGSQALTNKTGLISQWTNDAGYITSETDNQTLSFVNPDLTISNGNTVDITMYDQTLNTTDDVTFNSVTSDFFGVQHFTAKARETISAGQPVYISGHSGNTPEVMVADYADPAKMPAFGIASADIANNTNGSISTYGDLKNVDTTGSAESETWAVGDSLYVNGSKLTNIRPSSETQEVQKIAKIIRVHANTGQMFLMGAGRSNDTPNLDHYHVFIGNAGGVEKRQLTYTDILNTPTIPTNNNQLTNGAGYTTNTGTVTPTSTDTFTNKSGNISQWTNDAGYLTSETDNQTLSFANPNLSISSGNSVDLSALTPTSLAWSAITSTPTTIAGYGITDAFDGAYSSLTGTPTIPTQTVINNNADNRLITGSATADNLNGESDFTWDGTNALIDGTATDLTTPVLHLKTDNSNWFTGQLMCSDSNGAVFTQVGRHNTGNSVFQWNITLDPEHTEPRTNVPGNGVTWPGDYFVGLEKNYSDTDEITMDMKIYGAHDGFNLTVNDDFNGGVDSYSRRPMSINARQLRVYTDSAGSTRSLDVTDSGIKFFNAYTFPTTDGSANQVLQTDGSGNITFQTVSGGGSPSITPTLTGDATGYQGLDYVIGITNYSDYVRYSQMNISITKDSDSSTVISNNMPTDNGDGTFTVTIPGNATGAHTVRVKAQNFGQAESAEATMSLTLAALNVTARYWRIKDFDGGSGPAGTNTSIMVANFRMYDASGQTGTAYPSNMTTHNAPTPFYVTAQGAYSAAYDDWKAFDSDPTNTFYWNLGTTNMDTDYIAIDLGSAQSIKSWSFKSGNSAAYTGPFTIYYATQSDFSDEVKLKSLEFTSAGQVVNFG